MNQKQFLSECGKSYPEVIAAMAYFRQSIQQQCKPVVQKRIPEFAEVLGIPVKALKIMEYAQPDKLGAAVSDEICLGLQAKRSDDLFLYFYLNWSRKPDEYWSPLSIVISIWLKDGQKREKLAAELERHGEDAAFKDAPWMLGDRHFWLNMKEGEIPQVGDKLDALFGHTIGFLKSLKGIKDYFRA
jgi:hypothetical protein